MQKPRFIILGKKLLLTFFLSSIIWVLFIITSGASGQEKTGTQQESWGAIPAFAGAEECAACHEDLANAIQKTVHGKKGFEMRSDKDCETCHGPGTAHIESGGDTNLIKSFKTMKASEASEVCLQCHESGKRIHWKGSVHQQRDLACTSCHSVHSAQSEKFQLKTVKLEDTCASCHLQIKAQIQRSSHHPIREGLISCADCHNAHGTAAPKMITANSINEQCYTCHTEKRGPFLWDHAPVRENCLNCHTPHGSSHPKLMVAKRPYLCQSCHLDTRHPGTLYDGTNLLISNREFSRSCSNCHLAIHGSNHPSGWTFLR